LPTLGVGAGVAVGRGVGFGLAVGFVVGVGLGVGVGPPPCARGGLLAPVGGVGVGPSATMGPLGVALAEGSTDGEGADEPGGVDSGGVEPVGPGVADAGAVDSVGLDGTTFEAPGVVVARATSGPVGLGVISPAVNATVARMRFRRPRATTRRAR